MTKKRKEFKVLETLIRGWAEDLNSCPQTQQEVQNKTDREFVKIESINNLLKQIQAKQEEDHLFVVFYSVIGSQCTGSYLVNARDKKHAVRIVQSFDEDYARVTAWSLVKGASLFSGTVTDLLEGLDLPKYGDATHIESGT